MNVAVKSKKRKDHGPYGGNERSGKKAKSDAREPSPTVTPLFDSGGVSTSSHATPIISDTSAPSHTSYYRPRVHIPTPTPPPALHSLTTKSHVAPVAFDVDTFDLSDNKTLETLNKTQLRAVCLKHDISTARSNVDTATVSDCRWGRWQLRALAIGRAQELQEPVVEPHDPARPDLHCAHVYAHRLWQRRPCLERRMMTRTSRCREPAAPSDVVHCTMRQSAIHPWHPAPAAFSLQCRIGPLAEMGSSCARMRSARGAVLECVI
ncbi:hypothetical protein B0H11DRAFT_2186105, partial [Mycena galericulata]